MNYRGLLTSRNTQDNQVVVRLLEEGFDVYIYNARHQENSSESALLDTVLSIKPDIIFIDDALDSGIEEALQIHNDPRTSHIIIFLLTPMDPEIPPYWKRFHNNEKTVGIITRPYGVGEISAYIKREKIIAEHPIHLPS